MTFPKCFNSKDEFEAWVKLAERTKVKDPRLSFCQDCSLVYKSIMINEDRCEHPETIFITFINDDGELEDIGYNGRN